jgi:hypothetical protein
LLAVERAYHGFDKGIITELNPTFTLFLHVRQALARMNNDSDGPSDSQHGDTTHVI